MKTIVASLILAVATARAATAAPLAFQSSARQVSLVELYTSEGCSSCPPAENWLNQLKDSPGLWKNFVPVAFHVDYWNSLGWKDRWSSPQASARQLDYAQLWHAENVYTPCFALDGVEWHGWLHRRDVPETSGDDVGILKVRATGTNRWSATFVPVKPLAGNLEIHAAVLSCDLDSDVKAGENQGHTLHHEFAVLDVLSIGMANSNDILRGKFILDLSHYSSEKNLALAVWITHPGEMLPLQATGGWLPRATDRMN